MNSDSKTVGKAENGFRPAVARAAESLLAMRTTIATQHAANAPGVQTCALASDLCDKIILAVWQAILDDLPPTVANTLQRRVAIVAHGGYGRREMSPYSDVDLMLLHESGNVADREGGSAQLVTSVAKRLLQDLFDAGFDVGQSVRTVNGAQQLAAADATILSALLDCRRLAGNAELVERLLKHLRIQARRAPLRNAERLIEARTIERTKFGQTVAMLEPNVKRSPGGLRDIQLIHWLGMVRWNATSLDELVRLGVLLKQDVVALKDAAEFLARLRNDLHIAAGKCADDLTRDEQLRITQARGIEAREGVLGVERFMREYFQHTRQVAHILDNILLRARRPPILYLWLLSFFSRHVDGQFCIGPHSVGVLFGCLPQVTGSLASIMRLVELSVHYDRPIDHVAWEAVRVGAAALPREADEATKKIFLQLLCQPKGLANALRRLHEVGLLEVIIPQFAHARHLMQFNNYHKFTVDEHCILAVERAIDLTEDSGWLGDVWRQLNRKQTVLLALLIHDLGKGFLEDHSEIGAEIARDVAMRLGLSHPEGEILEFLVRKHLSMAHVAFRRNVGDDSLVVRFACEVGSPEVLQMLTVLTAADISAVGPGTWSCWKADLLGDLYYRTLGFLDGETPTVAVEHKKKVLDNLLASRGAEDETVQLARGLPLSYIRNTEPNRIVEELGQLSRMSGRNAFVASRWQAETSTLALSIGTREDVAPGVFHRLTGALTSQRLEILAADIHTLTNHLVIDHFTVQDPDYTGEPPAERVADIAAAIHESLKADHTPFFSRRWDPFTPRLNPATLKPPRVLFDNESSEHTTILEVFAHDSVGLLYAIAKILFDASVSVKAAKIGTYLDQVVDAFHITDQKGEKLTDDDQLAAIRLAIERAAMPLTGPGRIDEGIHAS